MYPLTLVLEIAFKLITGFAPNLRIHRRRVAVHDETDPGEYFL
jgi:hypothetical protein